MRSKTQQGPRLMAWTTKSSIWGNHWVPLGCRALLGSVNKLFLWQVPQNIFLPFENQPEHFRAACSCRNPDNSVRNYYSGCQADVKQISDSCQAGVIQVSESHQAGAKQMSDSHKAIVRHWLGSCWAVVMQSSRSLEPAN